MEAYDASAGMAEAAAKLTGLPVAIRRHEELAVRDRYDGIWACASLLHLPREAFPVALERLLTALRPGGLLGFTLKKGEGAGAFLLCSHPRELVGDHFPKNGA